MRISGKPIFALAALLLLGSIGCSRGSGDNNNSGNNGGNNATTPAMDTCMALGCADQNRACDDAAETPACLDCFEDHIERDGACFKTAEDCETLDCGAVNKSCTMHDGNPICGMCAVGFHEEAGSGACVANTATSCESGYVPERCALDNRECVTSDGGGASCGDCLPGHNEVEGQCVSNCKTCADEGRVCNEDKTCGDCLMGQVEEGGTCRPVKTCAETTCADGEVCIPSMTEDATCQATPCDESAGEAFVKRTGQCITCDFGHITEGCSVDASTGKTAFYPITAGNESCVCVPESGYYWDTSAGFNKPVSCDLDGDGWVNTNAVTMRYSGDPVLYQASNSCDLSEIDRVVLRNDRGQQRDILITDASIAGTSLRDSEDRVRTTIVLQETARNDNPKLLEQAFAARELLPYRGESFETDADYEQKAKKLNTLTRYCHDVRSDYNGDGTPDIYEEQFRGRATNDFEVMAKLTHFVEVNAISIEPSPEATDPHPLKQLVITERSRGDGLALRSLHEECGNSVDDDGDGATDCGDTDCQQTADCSEAPQAEVCWDGADNDGDLHTDCDDADCQGTHYCDHWQRCHRFRDPLFDDTNEREKIGTDFAQFGPGFKARSSAASEAWEGMNHSSQFKCLDIQVVLPAEVSAIRTNTIESAALKLTYDLISTCRVGETDPSDPKHPFTCTQTPAKDVSSTQVAWGARGYINGGVRGVYRGGCVNECDLSTQEPWSKLDTQMMGGPLTACPGWSFNPADFRKDQCRAMNSNYGAQFCAPTACLGTRHTSNVPGTPTLEICKTQSTTGGAPVLTGSDFTLQGVIPSSKHETNALCDPNLGCENGYSLR